MVSRAACEEIEAMSRSASGLEAHKRIINRPSAEPPAIDPINPAHYRGDTVMRIIEDFDLGFCLGNVVKYILRHAAKAGLEDLKKARWYLDREITRREAVAK